MPSCSSSVMDCVGGGPRAYPPKTSHYTLRFIELCHGGQVCFDFMATIRTAVLLQPSPSDCDEFLSKELLHLTDIYENNYESIYDDKGIRSGLREGHTASTTTPLIYINSLLPLPFVTGIRAATVLRQLCCVMTPPPINTLNTNCLFASILHQRGQCEGRKCCPLVMVLLNELLCIPLNLLHAYKVSCSLTSFHSM